MPCFRCIPERKTFRDQVKGRQRYSMHRSPFLILERPGDMLIYHVHAAALCFGSRRKSGCPLPAAVCCRAMTLHPDRVYVTKHELRNVVAIWLRSSIPRCDFCYFMLQSGIFREW